jgi:HK97 family phage prohead protease
MSQQNIQFKAIPGQFNIDEAQGVVECFVAGIGNKDSVGDVLITGAFTKSLTRRKPRVVWGHNWNDPIGKVLEIYEVAPGDRRLPTKMLSAGIGGLYAKVQFNLNSEKGREAFANVAFFGQEQEWSIGYKTLDSIFDPNIQANILKEVELYEVSPVLHGANQLTGTISVKSDETAEKHMPGMMMPHHEGMSAGPKIVVVRRDDDEDDDDKPIFSEGLAQAIGDNEKERLVRELQARSGSSIQLVSATESTAKFRRMTSDGRSVMYRIGYHTPDNYVTFMFGKPELAEGQQTGGSRTVVPSQMPSMPMQVKPQVTTQSTNFVVSPEYVMPKGEDYEKSAFDEELENLAQILDETFDVKVGRTLSSRNMSKLKTVLETLQDIVSSAEKDVESKSGYIIPVQMEKAFETKQLLDPIFDYHRVESHVTEDGIVITTGVTQEFIEAIGVAEKALGRTLSGGVGKLGRAGRGAVNFDPKAWDGDGDGIVQEGTPYSRPAIPGVNDRASGGRVDSNAATRAWQNQRRAGMASRVGSQDSSAAEVVSDLPENLVNDIANSAVRAVGRNGDETRLIDGAKEVLANLTNEKLKDSVGKSVSNARKRLAEMLSDEKVIEEFQSRKAIEDFMDEVGYAVQKMLDLHVGSVKKTGTSVEIEEIEEIVDNAKSKFDDDFNELVKASKDFWNKRRKPGKMDNTPEEAKKTAAEDRKNLMNSLRAGGEPEDLEATLGSIYKIFDDDSEKIISGTISVEDLNYLTEKALDQIIENDPSIDPEELVNEFAEALREGASKNGANPLIVALAKEFGDEKITGGDLIDYLNDARQNSVYRPDRGKIERENIRGFASRIGSGDGSADKREMDMTLDEYAKLQDTLASLIEMGRGANDADIATIEKLSASISDSQVANDAVSISDSEIDDYLEVLKNIRENGGAELFGEFGEDGDKDNQNIDLLIDSLEKTKDSTTGKYMTPELESRGGARIESGSGTARPNRPFKSANGTINPHRKLDFELDDSQIGILRDELDGFMRMTNNPGPLRAVAEKLEKATNGKFSVDKDEYEEVIKEIERLRTDKKIVTSDFIGLLEQAAESQKGKYSSIDVNGGQGFASSTGGSRNNGAPSDIPETMQKQLIMWGRQQGGLRLVQEAVQKFDQDKGTLPASYWKRLRTMYENMGPGSASGAARRSGRRGIFGRGKDTDTSPRGSAGFIIDDKPAAPKGPINTDGWEKVGGQLGSQPGAKLKDPKTGKEYYVKEPKSQLHAENESLVTKLYDRLGVGVGRVQVGERNGKPKIVSEWLAGSQSVSHRSKMSDPKWKKSVQDSFVATAWLANWDATANSGNIVEGADGKPYIIDSGGGLLFRARGEAKGSRFGAVVGEMDSLRDRNMNSLGYEYFNDIPAADISRQVKEIGSLSDKEIRQMVEATVTDKAKSKEISDTLIARRDNLVQNWSTGKNSGTGRRGRTGLSSSSEGYEGRSKRPGVAPGMRPADFEVRPRDGEPTGVGKGGAMGTKPDPKFDGDSFDQVKPEKWNDLTIDEKWGWMLGEGNPEKGGTMSPAAYQGAMKKLGEEEAREELKQMTPEERRKARSASRESAMEERSDNEKERLSSERAERQKETEKPVKRVKEEATAESAQVKRQALLDAFNEWIDDSVRELSGMDYDETDINPDSEDIWDTVSTILGVEDITPKSLNEAIDELSSYVDVNSPGENAYEKKSVARANALLKKLSKMQSEYSEDKWFNGTEGARSGFQSSTGDTPRPKSDGRPDRPGTPETPQSNAKREGDIKKLSTLIEQVVAELDAKRQNPSPKKGRMGFSSSTGKTMITDEATFFKDVEDSLGKEIRAAQKARNTKAASGLTKLQEIIKKSEASKTGDRRTNSGSIYMTMDEVDSILDGLQFALDQQIDAGGDKRIAWYSKLVEKIAAAAMSTFIDKSTTEIGSTRRTVVNKDGVRKKINIVPEP